MPIIVKRIETKPDLNLFVKFPWRIYKNDNNWVPPLLQDRYDKLDIGKNRFWRNADRALFMAWKDGIPAGTIAAIHDRSRNERLHDQVGLFGFFECINDREVAGQLFQAADKWLRTHGMKMMRGPFNPSPSDELGVLIDGFDTRPAMLEAHSPCYYAPLFEHNNFRKYQEVVARIVHRADAKGTLFGAFPEKFVKVTEIVKKRVDLVIRPVIIADWDNEIRTACDLYNRALSALPEFVPIPFDEFRIFANSFKPFMDTDLALMAFVKGEPIGFALALPDMNGALQHINGRLDPISMLKLFWYSRRLKRASFKILVMLPQYQGSGIESVLVMEVSRALWEKRYEEVDMSLTGDENTKSNRYQDNLGMKVYRRYIIYEKDI